MKVQEGGNAGLHFPPPFFIMRHSLHMKASPANRFSAAAASYDRQATVQRTVAARTLALAPPRPPPRRILDIGCGTGLLTSRLCRKWPRARVTAADLSPVMIQHARKRLKRPHRIQWLTGDFRRLPLSGPFDLVASSSALQWMLPLVPVFRKIRRLLSDRGCLVFSLMIRGTLRELHAARRSISPSKIPRQRLPDRNTVLEALKATGLNALRVRRETLRATHASAAVLLRRLHALGVTGGDLSSSGTPLTRGELERLVSFYNRRYKDGKGGVVATYEVLYVTAKRA